MDSEYPPVPLACRRYLWIADRHVVHASVVDDYIKKFGGCPLTGKKCTKKDVIMLKEGGTGFAAHGSESVEVTKWANAGHYG